MSSVLLRVLNELKLTQEFPESVVHLLEEKFKSLDFLFSGLTTVYQQQKFFQEHFQKIVSLYIQDKV